MSNESSGSENAPPGDNKPPLGPGPYPTSDIHKLFTAVDIHRNLGKLEKAVESLEGVVKSHGERIQQVTRQTDETKFAQAIVDRAVAIHGDRLRRLDKIAFVVELVGTIVAAGILVPLLTYLVHRFWVFLSR
jgi:hypothetical protein